MTPRSTTCLVVFAALLTASITLSNPAIASGADGAATGKSGKCKAGQIPVKIKKKKRCRPFKSAFPKPANIDPRLSFLRAALSVDLSSSTQKKAKGEKAKGKKGRRPGSVKRGFGRAGRKAYKAILRALPKAFARIDRLAPERAPTIYTSQAAISASGCPDTPAVSSTFSDGGVNSTVTLSNAGMAMVITFTIGDYSFRIKYSTSEGCGFDIPRCPTADGTADSRRNKSDRALIEVRRDGVLLTTQSAYMRRETMTHGQVAADAKLDYVDVEDHVTISSAYNGTSLHGTLDRSTRINMRTEQYDPARSRMSVSGAQNLQGLDRGGIAALANGVITRYRIAESSPGSTVIYGTAGWSVLDRPDKGNYCIRAKFNPETSSIKVKKGQSGTLTGQAISQADGAVASDARWQTTEVLNGTFTPVEPRGGTMSVTYEATRGGPDFPLIVEYAVRSTAGVAEYAWNADTEDAKTINRISGTLGGGFTIATVLGPSKLDFSGSLVFDRAYPAIFGGADGVYILSSGSWNQVASGIDGSGITGCHQTGSGNFALDPDVSSMVVTGTGPELEAPYTYSLQLQQQFQQMTVTRINCPAGAEQYEGTTYQTSLFAPPSTLQTHTSTDGVTYVGSEDQTFGGSGATFDWSLMGTE